jgi:uncharacterized protein YuzE
MRLEYDAEADAAYIRFSEKPSSRTGEESDVCIVVFDRLGNSVAIELLSVFGFAGASSRHLSGRSDFPVKTRSSY